MRPQYPLDPLGEYEDQTTLYTLRILIPARPPGRFSRFLHRPPPADFSTYMSVDPLSIPPPGGLNNTSLSAMKSKTIKLKAWNFPLDFRCSHVEDNRSCDRGCYVLERGGEEPDFKCSREDCEGHRWVGGKKKDGKNRICFGKKGDRLVCIGE